MPHLSAGATQCLSPVCKQAPWKKWVECQACNLFISPKKTFLTHVRIYCHMIAILSIPHSTQSFLQTLRLYTSCLIALRISETPWYRAGDWHLSVIAGSRRQDATLTAQASLDPSLIVSHNGGLRFISANILIINWISWTNAVSCRYKHVVLFRPWGQYILKG